MTEMNEAQLKEALEHDAAIKGRPVAPDPIIDKTIDDALFLDAAATSMMAVQIENRNSVFAKDLVTGFMQVAKDFAGMALVTGKPHMQKTEAGDKILRYEPPKPAAALQCLDAALRAMELARMADALGDRAIVRQKAE